jgi:hypothetical protein
MAAATVGGAAGKSIGNLLILDARDDASVGWGGVG